MKEKHIERVTVIGAGLMGLGIAVEFARFGYQVSIYNTNQASSQKAMERAGEDLELMVEAELLTAEDAKATYNRLRPATDLEDAPRKKQKASFPLFRPRARGGSKMGKGGPDVIFKNTAS